MAVLNRSIAASGDDGYIEASSSTFNNSGGNVFMGNNAGEAREGFYRFTNISIPPGSVINSAVITWVAQTTDNNAAELIATGHDVDNAPAPANVADVTGAARTTASVAWSPGTWSSGSTQVSPDLKSIVQEIVDRGGWSSGNSIVIFVGDNGSLTNRVKRPRSFDHVTGPPAEIDIDYTPPNTPPTITVNPSVNYNGYTRTGPNNTPISVGFTATDAEETGSNALSYQIRTASGAGGTLVASGNFTSGTPASVNIAHNASGINEGSNTLYLRVSDGTEWAPTNPSFTLLVDRTQPASFTPSSNVTPVQPDRQYTVAITANDTHSTGTNELTVEVRTAASGGGTLLWTGSRTASGSSFNTGTITDSGLVHGSNTRYARVIDGAGNIREASFTVTASFTVSDSADAQITFSATADGEVVDHYIYDSATAGMAFSATAAGVATPLWASASGSIVFAADADGFLFTPYVSGSATANLAFTATADGLIAYLWSDAAGSITFGATADGVNTPLWASASGQVTFSTTADGVVVDHFVSASADGSIVFSTTAAGLIAYLTASASGSLAFGASADGVIGYLWSSTTGDIAFTATADGYVVDPFISSSATATLVFTATATGIRFPIVSSIIVSPIRRIPRPVLSLYPPLAGLNAGEPLDQISIDPQSSGLVLFSRIPGGFGEMTANIGPSLPRLESATYSPWQSEDNRFRHFGHVELTDGDLTLFEGRMAQSRYVAGEVAWIRAMGYGRDALRDDEYESSSTSGITSGQIIRQALSAAAPNVRPASGTLFIDPQVEHEPVEFDRMTPASILDQVAREGNDSGDLMDWAVWEGRRLHLLPRVAPSTPHYAIAAGDKRITSMERDASDLRGQVRVAYKDATSGDDELTEWVSNPRFVDTYQLQRRITIPAGTMSATAAARMAQGYLRNYSSPRLAITIETSNDDTLPGPHGEPIPAYMARAGEWWLVGNDTLIALEVQQDWGSGRTRIQLGDESETFDAWLAWMNRDIEARQAGMNPRGGRSS